MLISGLTPICPYSVDISDSSGIKLFNFLIGTHLDWVSCLVAKNLETLFFWVSDPELILLYKNPDLVVASAGIVKELLSIFEMGLVTFLDWARL